MLPFARMMNYGNIVPVPLQIKKIIPTDTEVVVLYTDGQLYARGSNSYGKFGRGNNNAVRSWTLIRENVKDCWMTQGTLLVQDNDLNYFYCGYGSHIGLETSTTSFLSYNQYIENLYTQSSSTSIKQMYAGTTWFTFLMDNNTIWSTGWNSARQFADGTGTTYQISDGSFVKAVTPDVDIAQIQSTNYCAMFFDTQNNLYIGGSTSGISTSTTWTPFNEYTLYKPSTTYTKTLQYTVCSFGAVSALVENPNTGARQFLVGGLANNGAWGNNTTNSTALAVLGNNSTTLPSGTYYSIHTGYASQSSILVTSTGVYATGLNASGYAGTLGVGSNVTIGKFTACPLPSGITYSMYDKIKIYRGSYRTFLTADMKNIYSTGTHDDGGPRTNRYVLDTPRQL
ncbi:Uncharacterised protein [Escherichia coli]|uniref:hypothetical protein n=1 Tax=Escherichia coli TaxID=562 RepID=UPI001A4D9E10|nr:hypothetical protein [Escherichia coli]VVZ33516.1 Uncharacterised protein [Escherichia coli]HBC8455130.1 hypothetical protein [Escherichia coli]